VELCTGLFIDFRHICSDVIEALDKMPPLKVVLCGAGFLGILFEVAAFLDNSKVFA